MILDLVFNHTGESDVLGPDPRCAGWTAAIMRGTPNGTLINDTGTGNTLDCRRAHGARS